jgi:ATP-dependent helicase/nuclease subunit A
MSTGQTDVKTLTTEQGAAIEPEASVWLAASAGTGKTQVLTARVLRLLLEEDVEPENILCVTFTKAAAAEMQHRIFATLSKWVGLKDAALLAELKTGLNVRQAETKLDRARCLFAQTLDSRGGLKIQTLHSFCQSLLTRFPLEAAIAPGFATLDEQTDMSLQASALDSEIAHAFMLPDRQFLSDMTRLAERADDESLRSILRKLVSELAKCDPHLQLRREGFAPRVRQLLGLPMAGDAQAWLDGEIASGRHNISELKYIASVWQQGKKNLTEQGVALADWTSNPTVENIGKLKQSFMTKDNQPRKDLSDSSTKKVDADIGETAREAQNQAAALIEKINLFHVAEMAAAALRISWAVLQSVEQTKLGLGLVSFNDLIGKVAELLGSASGDWVRYRLDDQITHVLVDEAQDTNADQWTILSALTEDFFAGHSAQQKPRSMFVVGDYKQSIFRFQGADPQIFNAEKPKLATRVSAVGQKLLALPLSTSFRSAPAIIDFVNAAIPPLGAGQLGAGADFERHVAHRAGAGGSVSLWPLTLGETSDADPDDVAATLDRPWEDGAERTTAAKIARQIADWLKPDSQAQVRGRTIMPADIMVLVRKRGLLASVLVSDLKAAGVPVAGADRMKLGDQLVVQDMLAIARFALQPEDDLTLACVLKSPFICFVEDELFALAHGRNRKSLWSVLQEAQDHATVAQALRDILHLSDRATPYDFFASILEKKIFGKNTGRQQLFARLGADSDDPLSMLLDEALTFERDHASSLQAFVAWMETDDKELKRDPETPRNEVRVMTVHGSKGLQAKIIILADSHGVEKAPEKIVAVGEDAQSLPVLFGASALRVGVLQQAHEAELDRARQDYWRLFYVAITRAEDALYFAGWQPGRSLGRTSWYEHAQTVFDMMETQKIDDPLWGSVRHFSQPRQDDPESVKPGQAVPQRVLLPEWALSPAPVEPVPPRPLSPSQLGGEELLSGDAPLAQNQFARERGTALHRLLELLPDVAVSRRSTVAARLLAQTGLPAEQHAALLAEAEAVMAHPAFAPVFAPGSLAEVPVTAVLGKAVLSGQIDRLAVTADEVLIVDYKTTARPPATATDVPLANLRQMAAYRLALLHIYPGRKISAALLWTATPMLMPLADDLLESIAARFEASFAQG